MFAGKNYLVHTLGLNGEMEILDHAQVNTNMILFRCVIMSVVMETIQIQHVLLEILSLTNYLIPLMRHITG